jgi:phosphatidylglycerol---prolipoprotein diacylglyceryl transferase
MFPVLFKIPLFSGIPIYSYGVLVATAFLMGIFWASREAKMEGVDPDFVLDLAFYVVISAIIGSRIVFILVEWERYAANPLDVLKIWEGGLVFYGGFIGALIASFVYIKTKGHKFLRIGDLMIPGLALGHMFGRFGCFFAGCCYGRPVPGDPFWAITFPFNATGLAPAGVPLFPSQLLEAGLNFIIFLVLIFIRRNKKFTGQVLLSYMIIYGIVRSILEIFRGDAVRGYVIPEILTTSQFISSIFVFLAIVSYFWLSRKSKKVS